MMTAPPVRMRPNWAPDGRDAGTDQDPGGDAKRGVAAEYRGFLRRADRIIRRGVRLDKCDQIVGTVDGVGPERHSDLVGVAGLDRAGT
jgi:hypothetical protein